MTHPFSCNFSSLLTPLIVGVGLLLGACSKNDKPETYVRLKEINISLDGDANDHSATSIDLVIAYSPALTQVLMKMDARTYFASAAQLRQDYPDLADVYHWEMTPGQLIKDYPIKLRSKDPQSAFIFADYYAPGPHRIRVGSSKAIHVQLQAIDFCIQEQGCPGKSPSVQDKDAETIRANLLYSDIKGADPRKAIAASEAVQSAEALKTAAELEKAKAEQIAKFIPR